jgi:hypothetical protein
VLHLIPLFAVAPPMPNNQFLVLVYIRVVP